MFHVILSYILVKLHSLVAHGAFKKGGGELTLNFKLMYFGMTSSLKEVTYFVKRKGHALLWHCTSFSMQVVEAGYESNKWFPQGSHKLLYEFCFGSLCVTRLLMISIIITMSWGSVPLRLLQWNPEISACIGD